MMREGPEALLIAAATNTQSQRELAQYGRLEYSRAGPGGAGSLWFCQFEAMPTKGSALVEALRRGFGRLRRPVAAASTSMAALPAMQRGLRAERASPLSAAPTAGRS